MFSYACYALGSALCYLGKGRVDNALAILRSMNAYYENYHRWRYPDGLLVHRMIDLEAEIERIMGNSQRALTLVRENLRRAKEGQFVIADWRARQSMSREILIAQLEDRVRTMERNTLKDKGNMSHAVVR